MRKRIVVGLLLIGLISAVLWLDWRMERDRVPRLALWPDGRQAVLVGLPLATLMLMLVVKGYGEMRALAASAGLPMCRLTGLLCTGVIVVLPFWRQVVCLRWLQEDLPLLLGGATVLALFLEQLIRHRTQQVLARLGVTLLAVAYLGVCGAVVVSLRTQFGLEAFLMFLGAVKAADIGAYFAGSWLGRHKMIPWLSPGKSWEGLAGGLAAAALAGAGLAAAFRPVVVGGGMSPAAGAVFGLVVGLVGQGADLCESAMKRDAGMKDSGRLVPGFGGVLDLMDSPLLAAPAGYVCLNLVR